MSGHSKWNNIKREKGKNDLVKNALFTRLAKEISTAVKVGGSSDPSSNSLLKIAIERAKAANMQNVKIENVIKKAAGISDQESGVNNIYEIISSDGLQMLVEVETDNSNRTLTEIKILANKLNLKLVGSGSIAWKFIDVGLIKLQLKDESLLEEIVLGEYEILDYLLDNKKGESILNVIVKRENLKNFVDFIKAKNIEIKEIQSLKILDSKFSDQSLQEPQNLDEIIEKFEEIPEVISISHNFTKII